MDQVMFGGNGTIELPAGAVQYAPILGSFSFNENVEGETRSVIPSAGKLRYLRFVLNDAPGGAGKDYTFHLMLNGAPTALVVVIANLATSGSDMANEIDVVAGDEVSLRCTPTGTPDKTEARYTIQFTGSTAGESIILGSTTNNILDSGATGYRRVMGCGAALVANENEAREIVPTAGTIKNLYVELSLDPGDDPEAYRFTVRLNGATVGQSLIVTITADATTGNDVAHNLVVAAGDVLTMMIEPLNTPTVEPTARWGMTFVATIDGESLVLSGTAETIGAELNNGHNYIETDGRLFSLSSSWSLGQITTLRKMHWLLSAAPGGVTTRTLTIEIAVGGDGNQSVTIVDPNTWGSDLVNTDVLVNDNVVGVRQSFTGAPAAAYACWSVVGYIDPAAPPADLGNKSANMGSKMVGAGLI